MYNNHDGYVNPEKNVRSDLEKFEILSERFSIIPLDGKKPVDKKWQKYCQEKRAFDSADFHGLNAGICCGPASGVLVLDVDDASCFQALCKENGWNIPDTYSVSTGGGFGKRHLYFQYPGDNGQYGGKNSRHPIFPAYTVFDIRGIGGQVVAPGSVHPVTGQVYKVIKDVPIALPPVWLLNVVQDGHYEKDSLRNIPPESSLGNPADLVKSMKISQVTKDLILKPAIKGERSENVMSVLKSLVGYGFHENIILYLFNTYPIGEKYREKGSAGRAWFSSEIQRARSHNQATRKDFLKSKSVLPPVVEIEECLHRVKYDKLGKPAEYRKISEFCIKPLESIFVDDEGEYLKVHLRSGKVVREVVLPPDCWVSNQKFLKYLIAKEFCFYGRGVDVQFVRNFLSSFNMPHKTGLRIAGFHNGVFITEDGALTSTGSTDNLVFISEIDSGCRLLKSNSQLRDDFEFDILKKFNTLSVVLPVLGFAVACFFKPRIVDLMKTRLEEITGFPLLIVEGGAGAGKTQTISNILMRLWAIEGEPKMISQLTKFSFMKIVSLTNCIPVVLDENKANMQTDREKKWISELIRTVYNREEGFRGKADQSMQMYRYEAPVVIMGETGFSESAINDRMLFVNMSVSESVPYKDNFFAVRRLPLESIGRRILEFALNTSDDDIIEVLSEEFNKVGSDLVERPRSNAAICRFGLRMLERVIDLEFSDDELRVVDDGTIKGVFGDSKCRKSACDIVIEGIYRMSAYRKLHDNTCDYFYADHFEEGVHYKIEGGFIWLYIAGIYPLYSRWARAHGNEHDVIPEGTFKRQLQEEPYCKGNKNVRIGKVQRRCFMLDVLYMINQKGLEIGSEWLTDEYIDEVENDTSRMCVYVDCNHYNDARNLCGYNNCNMEIPKLKQCPKELNKQRQRQEEPF